MCSAPHHCNKARCICFVFFFFFGFQAHITAKELAQNAVYGGKKSVKHSKVQCNKMRYTSICSSKIQWGKNPMSIKGEILKERIS